MGQQRPRAAQKKGLNNMGQVPKRKWVQIKEHTREGRRFSLENLVASSFCFRAQSLRFAVFKALKGQDLVADHNQGVDRPTREPVKLSLASRTAVATFDAKGLIGTVFFSDKALSHQFAPYKNAPLIPTKCSHGRPQLLHSKRFNYSRKSPTVPARKHEKNALARTHCTPRRFF